MVAVTVLIAVTAAWLSSPFCTVQNHAEFVFRQVNNRYNAAIRVSVGIASDKFQY